MGEQRLYGLDARGLQPLHEWTGGFEQFWNESFERLDDQIRISATLQARHTISEPGLFEVGHGEIFECYEAVRLGVSRVIRMECRGGVALWSLLAGRHLLSSFPAGLIRRRQKRNQ